MTPQPTEQYGQVLRVSEAWASLKSRTSATARSAEKPSAPTVVAPMPDAVSLRNPLRETCIDDLRSGLGASVRPLCPLHERARRNEGASRGSRRILVMRRVTGPPGLDNARSGH